MKALYNWLRRVLKRSTETGYVVSFRSDNVGDIDLSFDRCFWQHTRSPKDVAMGDQGIIFPSKQSCPKYLGSDDRPVVTGTISLVDLPDPSVPWTNGSGFPSKTYRFKNPKMLKFHQLPEDIRNILNSQRQNSTKRFKI